MIMHMLTYAGKRELDRYVCRCQNIRGAYAADLQKMWTSESTAGQDHFLVSSDTLHSGPDARGELNAGSDKIAADHIIGEREALCRCPEDDVQVVAWGEDVDVCGFRVGARPVGRVHCSSCEESANIVT